jgi:DNA-binding response OmpR family regulator
MTRRILGEHSVLYAEDHAGTQEIVAGYLARQFKEVYVALDGREALELYHKHVPDVLILDIDLPHMNGLAVAEEIRKINENILIVMLSAFSDTPKMLRAVKLNLCEYLIKPIKPKIFRETLEMLAQKLQHSASNMLNIGDTHRWDIDREQLWCGTERIALTHKESMLLALLVKEHKNVLEHTSIMAKLWEDNFDVEVSIDSVRQQVKLLRKKLPDGVISSVRGVGFKLN